MQEYYFLIRYSEDGLVIHKMLPKDMEKELEDWNDVKFLDDFPEDQWSKKREKIDRESNLNPGWDGQKQEFILIKGSFVVPKAVEVVKKLVIE